MYRLLSIPYIRHVLSDTERPSCSYARDVLEIQANRHQTSTRATGSPDRYPIA